MNDARRDLASMELTPFFFGLYKLSKYALYPLTWMYVMLALCYTLVVRQSATGELRWIKWPAAALFLYLYGLATPLVATILIGLLEAHIPSPILDTNGTFSAIVVLGGGAGGAGSLRQEPELSDASVTRTICGATLFERGLAPRLILSGGDAGIWKEGPREGDEMKRLAVRLGVPAQAIVVEGRSRTTYENAVETKRLVGADPILLVTSAYHLPRAAGLFRKQGFTLTPYPCGYLSQDRPEDGWDGNPFDLLPEASALRHSTMAINEAAAILLYRLAGRL